MSWRIRFAGLGILAVGVTSCGEMPPSYTAASDSILINVHKTGGYRGCVSSIYIWSSSGRDIYNSPPGTRYCKKYIVVRPNRHIDFIKDRGKYSVQLTFDGTPAGSVVFVDEKSKK